MKKSVVRSLVIFENINNTKNPIYSFIRQGPENENSFLENH